MKMRTAKWRRRLPPPTHRSVTARVIRAAVLAIGNSIAIAVAIHTIRHTIAIMIANTTMFATIPVRNLVSNTSGQQTAGDDHQQRKLLHVFSSTQRPNARRTEPITIDCNPCMPNLSCPASGFRRPCSEAPIGLATGHISRARVVRRSGLPVGTAFIERIRLAVCAPAPIAAVPLAQPATAACRPGGPRKHRFQICSRTLKQCAPRLNVSSVSARTFRPEDRMAPYRLLPPSPKKPESLFLRRDRHLHRLTLR